MFKTFMREYWRNLRNALIAEVLFLAGLMVIGFITTRRENKRQHAITSFTELMDKAQRNGQPFPGIKF